MLPALVGRDSIVLVVLTVCKQEALTVDVDVARLRPPNRTEELVVLDDARLETATCDEHDVVMLCVRQGTRLTHILTKWNTGDCAVLVWMRKQDTRLTKDFVKRCEGMVLDGGKTRVVPIHFLDQESKRLRK